MTRVVRGAAPAAGMTPTSRKRAVAMHPRARRRRTANFAELFSEADLQRWIDWASEQVEKFAEIYSDADFERFAASLDPLGGSVEVPFPPGNRRGRKR